MTAKPTTTRSTTKPTATKSSTTTNSNSRPSRSTTTTFTFKLVKFKPESLGKPDKDAAVHQLCSNDLMNAHHFVNGVKVQKFCLTLLGEARL